MISALSRGSAALNLSPPPTLAVYTSLSVASPAADAHDWGRYHIVGTVKEKGTPDVPVSRRVLLCDQLSARVVRSMWSVPLTGAYAFEHIRLGTFYVISFDHTGAFRAVVADNLVSEAMP